MDKSNHIVCLTPGFPENEKDSRCIPALQIYLKALKKENKSLEVTVISLDYPFKKDCFQWNHITIYSMNGKSQKGLKRVILWMKVVSIFLKINRNRKVTHIHSFWYGECAFIGSFISTFHKAAHICTLMGQDAKRNSLYSKAIIKKPILVGLSDFHAESIVNSLKIVPDRIIPWGLESSLSNNINMEKRDIDILGVGSLFPVKNFSLFIDLIDNLIKQNDQLICAIVGAGDEKDMLLKKISRLGISKNVKLIGGLERDEVLNYMSRSKLLLHTSNYESFGMIFIEALSVGTYVVSKPIGCYVKSHMWETGESKNELIEMVQKKLKQNNRKCIYPFDINKTVQEYTALYQLN